MLGRAGIEGALALLWHVQAEPAPSDLLFACAWGHRVARGRLVWYATLSTAALLGFIVVDFAQVLYAQEPARALWFAGVTAYVISLSFLLASSVRNWEEFAAIRRYYLAAALTVAGILLILGGLRLIGLRGEWESLYYGGRPRGFFKDPNVAGSFVATAALAALSSLTFRKNSLVTSAMGLATTAAAVLVTFSRGALLNLLVGALVLGFIALLRRRGARFMATAAVATVVAVPFLSLALGDFGQAGRFGGLTAYDIWGRLAAWRSGLAIARDAPWGIGPGQFEVLSPHYQRGLSLPELIVTPSAHNTYLRVLAENGLLGLAILLLALLSILRTSVNLALRASDSMGLATAAWLCSAWAGLLAQGFTIDALHWRHLWLVAGLILACRKLEGKRSFEVSLS